MELFEKKLIEQEDLFETLGKATNPSQGKRILIWLQAGKCLTSIEALNMFGCFRLSGRIYDLRKQGHDIKTEKIETSSGKWIAKYKLN